MAEEEKKLHGRCKISDVTRAHIIAAIEKNVPYEMAAWAARICERTLYDWIAIGVNDVREFKDTEYARLVQDIHQTEYKKVAQHTDAVEMQSERWQARSWILERRWRKHFGADAALIQELMDKQAQLQTMFERYVDKDKGLENNGKSD